MSLSYIRRHYGVPAKRGRRITFTYTPMRCSGRILSADSGAKLWIRRDDTGKRFGPLHPTWEIDWSDQG